MLVQWLTFAIMILIQTVAAVWIVSAIRTTLDVQGGEIKLLRERWHGLAPKVMMVEAHEKVIEDHETRIRAIEKFTEREALKVETLRIETNHGLAK